MANHQLIAGCSIYPEPWQPTTILYILPLVEEFQEDGDKLIKRLLHGDGGYGKPQQHSAVSGNFETRVRAVRDACIP